MSEIAKLKNDIACKQNIINHLAEHNIKLQNQLKSKEQECEELKKCLLQDQNASISLNKQLDKLKVENDLYKNAHKTEQDRRRSYENALTEIKDIAERISLPMGTGKSGNRVILAKQILQKISECEVENAR